MTEQQSVNVQRGVEIAVPLNKLKKSQDNARKRGHSAADVETLAASIAAKGMLQPPTVAPEYDANGNETGSYLVTIGEGRRLALVLLAKRRQISKTTLVRCLLDGDSDAFEVSLDENVTRFAMHPADQFEAFKELSERRNWSAEEIAIRFGIGAPLVRQRLRLGAVSPPLLAHYRDGGLTLEQLMAFAVCEDHARQERVHASLSYNRSPQYIRRIMTEHEVEAQDRRARFVGANAYSAAGGRIRRDLFVEDDGGWFEDVDLLDRLAIEKLETLAEALKRREGWKWVEAHLDYPQAHGLKRVYPVAFEPDEEAQVRLSGLSEEYDAILAACGESENFTPEQSARLEEIDAILDEASIPIYAEEDRTRAGVFVALDWDGKARIERGFLKPDAMMCDPTTEEASDLHERPSAQEEAKNVATRALSDRLVADLTAHRTAALRDRLALDPEAAFVTALHTQVLQTFYRGEDESCLELRATITALDGYAADYRASVAGRAIEARHEGWSVLLPEDADELWKALLTLHAGERASLFAHCVSLTLNAVKVVGRMRRSLAHADVLAAHLGLDMTTYWQATPQSYFSHVSKAQILETVREALSPETAERLEGLKKEAMAQAATELLGSEGWLPPLLKGAAVPPA